MQSKFASAVFTAAMLNLKYREHLCLPAPSHQTGFRPDSPVHFLGADQMQIGKHCCIFQANLKRTIKRAQNLINNWSLGGKKQLPLQPTSRSICRLFSCSSGSERTAADVSGWSSDRVVGQRALIHRIIGERRSAITRTYQGSRFY